MDLLRGFDCFTGIGGLTLALCGWVKPVAYCEADPYAQGVLLSRMAEGSLPRAPIWDDIRTLKGSELPKPIDIVYGGFPCQPFSSAARGRNLPDQLSAELVRVINETVPRYCFLENVSHDALNSVIGNLSNYKWKTASTRASAVGAPFAGRRHWAFGTAYGEGKPTLSKYEKMAWLPQDATNIWSAAPSKDVRMDDGVSFRVDRLRALGNAVVWIQAREAFKRLIQEE